MKHSELTPEKKDEVSRKIFDLIAAKELNVQNFNNMWKSYGYCTCSDNLFELIFRLLKITPLESLMSHERIYRYNLDQIVEDLHRMLVTPHLPPRPVNVPPRFSRY